MVQHKLHPSELGDEALLVHSRLLAPILSLSGLTGRWAPVALVPSLPAEARGESNARGEGEAGTML